MAGVKITELILQLHTEMLNRGNVDVYLGGNKVRQPNIIWADKSGDHPEGIYIH